MKRSFDVFFSIFLLIFLFPVLALVSVMVLVLIGSPILFFQTRPGLNAKPFILVKFRTMTSETDSNGILLEDKKRLNRFGRFLRSTSLDELPELWNVLKGDMSLVGPRPLLVEYLPLYSKKQSRRHEVKPGITGWAQVNGRNAISWEEKFKFDVWYVDNQSFWLDVKILLLTVKRIFQRQGIVPDGLDKMPKFKGNLK